ncbi:MAG TPA: hypothetical protein PKD79_02035 [Candidatus Doudnabacteria bacterium]|nr:hypothetical protein [Candidatus Doudnabacteria bacterium]
MPEEQAQTHLQKAVDRKFLAKKILEAGKIDDNNNQEKPCHEVLIEVMAATAERAPSKPSP